MPRVWVEARATAACELAGAQVNESGLLRARRVGRQAGGRQALELSVANLVQEHGRCSRFLHLGEAGNIVRGAQAQQAGDAGGGTEGLLCTGSALRAGGRRARVSK